MSARVVLAPSHYSILRGEEARKMTGPQGLGAYVVHVVPTLSSWLVDVAKQKAIEIYLTLNNFNELSL